MKTAITDPVMRAVSAQFWAKHLDDALGWLPEIRHDLARAGQHEVDILERTGTLSEASCVLLRAICAWRHPDIVVEIGTYIGSGTYCLRAQRIYTCDLHHDVVHSQGPVTAFPHHSSTAMLTFLASRGVRTEFMLWDGRIAWEDLPLIVAISTETTIYAFDDYERGEKGVVNVRRLLPILTDYRLIVPPPHVLDLESPTTLALLCPERLM